MPFNQIHKDKPAIDGAIVIGPDGIVDPVELPFAVEERPGFLPSGVYDTVLIDAGRAIDWAQHWKRFAASCTALNLNLTGQVSLPDIENAAVNADWPRAQCRLMRFHDAFVTRSQGTIAMLAMLRPAGEQRNETGIDCAVSDLRRQWDDQSYQHKLMGRREIDEELNRAQSRGFSDVVFLNNRNEVCEGAYSNIILVKGGLLTVTPDSAARLPGITQSRALSAAGSLGIPCNSETITLAEIARADEIWLTSSIRGLQWVRQLGNYEAPAEAPLSSMFARVKQECSA